MKGSIMAFFYMTVAVGDLMTGFVFNILSFLPIRWIFFVFASLMAAAFFMFVYVAKRYRRPVRHDQMDETASDTTGVSAAATTGAGTGSPVPSLASAHDVVLAGDATSQLRSDSTGSDPRGHVASMGGGRPSRKYQQLE